MMLRNNTEARIALIVALTLAGCGRNDGSRSEIKESFSKLTWVFQCPSDPIPIPVPVAHLGEIVYDTVSPHSAYRQQLAGTPVNVLGKVCKPHEMMRDIVFIIDVSGSMLVSDPVSGTKCGRLDAIDAVIALLPPNIVNYAITTFDDSQQAASDKFYSNKADLYNQITGGQPSKIHEKICAGIGYTEYTVGLNSAKTLFSLSRQFATKEIFFLTDGEPNETPGAITAITDTMKNVGVPVGGQNHKVGIATIMLGTATPATDAILKPMASTDSNGQPVYANAANASQLANVFSGLADNRLVGSAIMHGGDSQPHATIDIMSHLQTDMSFKLDPFALLINGGQSKYEVNFQYWDAHQNIIEFGGIIDWLD